MQVAQKDYRPIGNLARIFETYQPPKSAAKVLIGRVGGIIGIPGGIDPEHVEVIIQNTMARGTLPNWNTVTDILGTAAGRVHQGLSPFTRDERQRYFSNEIVSFL